MRRVLLTIILVGFVSSPAIGATLPLQDGDYTRGKCNGGSSDILESYDIQTVTEGREKGSRFLYPQAEGQEGGCITGKIVAKGNVYSGAAKCEGGGSRIQYSTGTNHFSLQVIGDRAFISKGKKYVWCAPHR